MIQKIFKKDEQELEGKVFFNRVLDEILPQIDTNLYNAEALISILDSTLRTLFRLISPYIVFKIAGMERIYNSHYTRYNIWIDKEEPSNNLKDKLKIRFQRLAQHTIGLGTNIDDHNYSIEDLRVEKKFALGLFNQEQEDEEVDALIASIKNNIFKKRDTTLSEKIPISNLSNGHIIALENLITEKLRSPKFYSMSDEELTEIYYFRDNILGQSQKVQAINENDI